MVDINKIQVKAFVGHSRGIRYADGADRIGVDVQRGRFVVADGVSQSHLPNVWADILAHDFIDSEECATLWGERLEKQLPGLTAKWRAESDNRLAKAEEKEKRLMERTWRNFGRAASTVAGVTLNEDGSLDYYQLGDSFIFMVDVEGNLKPFANLEEFGNMPDYVDTNRDIKGKFHSGTDYLLGAAYLVLMTDALSDWFVKAQQQDTHTIQQLWQIENHEQFWSWVEASRDDGSLKDDDVAMVLIKVTDAPVQERLLYCDDIDQLIVNERGETVSDASQPEQAKNEFLEGYDGFKEPPVQEPSVQPVPSSSSDSSSLYSTTQLGISDAGQEEVTQKDEPQGPGEESGTAPPHGDEGSIESQVISFGKFLLMGLMIANILFFALDGVACSFQDAHLMDAYWPWQDGYHPKPIFQLNFAYNAVVIVGLYFFFWLKRVVING